MKFGLKRLGQVCLLAGTFLLPHGVAAAWCPSGEAGVGHVTSAQGAVKVERDGLMISLGEGEALCSGDRLVAGREPVLYNIRCEGDLTLQPGYQRLLSGRKQFRKSCTGIGWKLFFFAERRDSEARSITLAPRVPAFGVAGLATGDAVLTKMPKHLVVPLDSVSSIAVDVLVTAPDGSQSWKKTISADGARAAVFDKLPNQEGSWQVELRTGIKTSYGAFRIDRKVQVVRKGDREDILAAACTDMSRAGFAALQMLGEKGVSDEDLRLMAFWSDPASGSLCAPDPAF